MALKKAGGLILSIFNIDLIYSDFGFELFGAGASSAVFFGSKMD
jgi:hypothetical protein